MQKHSESNDWMTNISEKEKMYFSLQMPEYEVSYAIPRLKDDIKDEVFIPQSLLNNPITDPEHSQYVQRYLRKRLANKVRKELKISVRKDLLIPKILHGKVNNKRAYEEIDLSNDREDETEDKTEEDKIKYGVHDKRTIDSFTAGSFKRNTSREESYAEPSRKTLKNEISLSKSLSHEDSAICLMATKQDLNGN